MPAIPPMAEFLRRGITKNYGAKLCFYGIILRISWLLGGGQQIVKLSRMKTGTRDGFRHAGRVATPVINCPIARVALSNP